MGNSQLINKILAIGLVVLAFAFCGLFVFALSSTARVGLKNLIARELVHVDNPIQEKAEAIYVLGTGYKGSWRHLKSAAGFYNRGISDKILYYHDAGTTACSRSSDRTLTRDEWVVKQLLKNGVPPFASEPVPVPEGFFGTYSEAEVVSAMIVQRKLKSILLITSPYHTKRARKCFDHFLRGKDVCIRVTGSVDRGYLRDHLIEYLKLKVYEWFLL